MPSGNVESLVHDGVGVSQPCLFFGYILRLRKRERRECEHAHDCDHPSLDLCGFSSPNPPWRVLRFSGLGFFELPDLREQLIFGAGLAPECLVQYPCQAHG